jgi:hypothetical protein
MSSSICSRVQMVADPELRSKILAENPDLRKYGQALDEEELRADAREAYRRLFGG